MKANPTCELSIEKFREGDESTFNDLFRSLYGPLCGFAEGIVKDELIAEELTQSAFIKLWKRHHNFDSLLRIKAFLYIAIKNEAFNHLKKEKNRLKLEQHFLVNSVSSEQNVMDQIIFTEVIFVLNRAIEALPHRCKMVIRRTYLEEKSSKEVAEEMGISISSVDNQRARGIKLLKRTLARVVLLCCSLLLFS